MATPEERERESRESDVTKYEELTEEVREEQKEAAERISEPLEPDDEVTSVAAGQLLASAGGADASSAAERTAAARAARGCAFSSDGCDASPMPHSGESRGLGGSRAETQPSRRLA